MTLVCGRCPHNKTGDNPIWKRLPPVHYCEKTNGSFHGFALILSEWSSPKWCPDVKPD
jgi:hypothetical protein